MKLANNEGLVKIIRQMQTFNAVHIAIIGNDVAVLSGRFRRQIINPCEPAPQVKLTRGIATSYNGNYEAGGNL